METQLKLTINHRHLPLYRHRCRAPNILPPSPHPLNPGSVGGCSKQKVTVIVKRDDIMKHIMSARPESDENGLLLRLLLEEDEANGLLVPMRCDDRNRINVLLIIIFSVHLSLNPSFAKYRSCAHHHPLKDT